MISKGGGEGSRNDKVVTWTKYILRQIRKWLREFSIFKLLYDDKFLDMNLVVCYKYK